MAGPDGICNEQIRTLKGILLDTWVYLFKRCLELSRIRMEAVIIKILNKTVNGGIARESNTFKIFTKILTKQLTDLVDDRHPESQFGFRRGETHSMLSETC